MVLIKKKKMQVLADIPKKSAPMSDGGQNNKMPKKLAKKQPARSSSTSPHPKKRQVLSDIPQKSDPTAGEPNNKTPKKLAKKKSTETSTSPHPKKRRVLADTPQKSDITSNGQKDSKTPKKLAKKRSAEASVSPHPKKRRVLAATPHKSHPTANDQNNTTPKKLAEVFSVDVRGINKSTCHATLVKYFGKFGEVTRVHLHGVTSMFGSHGGRGSVTFSTKEAADAVLAQTHLVDGQQVSVHASESTRSPSREESPASRLFISGIPQNVGKESLAQYFSQFGNIEGINLPTHVNDQSVHKGFAFLEFSDELAGKEALAAHQHKLEVDGTVTFLRVSKFKEPVPSKNKIRGSKLFVSGIPKQVGMEALQEHFSRFGELQSVILPRDADDNSVHRGFAFVEFVEFVEDLDREIALEPSEHKLQVDGEVFSIWVSRNKKSTSKAVINKASELFVGKIPQQFGKEDLEKHFSQFGSIKRITLPVKKEDPAVHKRIAFIEFTEELAKEKALKRSYHKLKVNGKSVSLCVRDSSAPIPEKKPKPSFKVFVGKIPQEVCEKRLKEHFSQFGRIKRIALPTKRDDPTTHRGVAFIEFTNELGKEEALAACNDEFEVNGEKVSLRVEEYLESAPKKVFNRDLELFVRKIPKEVGKEELEEHFSQFGKIESIVLPAKDDDPTAHRGFAFIEFANGLAKEEALAAGVHELYAAGNLTTLHVSEGKVMPKEKENKTSQLAEEGKWSDNSMVVFGLAPSTSAKTLSLHFGRYGKVVSVKIIKKEGKRNVAIVTFEHGGVEAALEEDHQIDNSIINVEKVKFSGIPLDTGGSLDGTRDSDEEKMDVGLGESEEEDDEDCDQNEEEDGDESEGEDGDQSKEDDDEEDGDQSEDLEEDAVDSDE